MLNKSGSGSILVTVADDFGGYDTETVNITVVAVADAPNLSSSDITGDEDVETLIDLSSSLNDTDGSENLTLYFTAVPDGCSLSNGTNNGDGSWMVLPEELSGLALLTPIHFNSELQYYPERYGYDLSGSLNIPVTAVSTESSNGDQSSVSTLFGVIRDAGFSISLGFNIVFTSENTSSSSSK